MREPYTNKDTNPEKACIICKHFQVCEIVKYINTMEKNRSRKQNIEFKDVSDEFSCSIFVNE